MRTVLTNRLREKCTRGGEGVQKAGKSAYVLNGCSLMDILVIVHKHRAREQLLLAKREKLVDRFIRWMCAGKVWVEVPAKYIHCTVITSPFSPLSSSSLSSILLSH